MNDLMSVRTVRKISHDSMIGRDIWNFTIRVRNSDVLVHSRMDDHGDVTRNSRGKTL